MCKIAVIGGGAAGMMVAIRLAENGFKPTIYEKNEKLGKKLFITGKGRCNLTNNCQTEDLFRNVVTNPKFMYSSFYGFDSQKTMEFFEGLGLDIKTERGGRVFPTSDHSSDVISVLSTRLKRLGVDIRLNTTVTDILCHEEDGSKYIDGIIVKNNDKNERIDCNNVIVATGGLSYPLTGSTGDGLAWAKKLGIDVTAPRPSLVPMNIREDICKALMGLSLKNVSLSYVAEVKGKDKKVYSDMGEMLFTHFGISGPLVLSASACIGKYIDSNLRVYIDLKPALTEEQLDARILRDFGDNINKQFRNSLNDLLPRKLIPYIIDASGIDQYIKVNAISREDRKKLVHVIKNLELHVEGFRGFDEAIITQGGIKVKELNPATMEVKHIPGLYFIGEVIDVDALTGGYNLQIAWSTAVACADAFTERNI